MSTKDGVKPEIEKISQRDETVVSNSAKSISSLIFVQILTKLFTFILNQSLIKFITPEIIGISSYLEFISNSILFFSRESIRLSIQRISNYKYSKGTNTDVNSKSGTLQNVINFGFIPVLIGIPIMIMVSLQCLYSNNIITLMSLPYWRLIIALHGLSIFSEFLIEPIYCLYQFQLDFNKRSKYESIAMFLKCVATFVSIFIFKSCKSEHYKSFAILSFSIGQFAYSFTLFVLYFQAFKAFNLKNQTSISYRIIQMKNDKERYYFQSSVLSVFRNFFIQMIFKQFLTEGDKLMISYLCTIEEQGVYTIISNYGSIIARLLFQPLEESTRLMLTKLLSDKNKSQLNSSLNYLQLICIFYFNLSVLILFGGVTNGSFLLKIILSNKSIWGKSKIFELFSNYVVYIPFLAFNGIVESMFSSIMTNKQMVQYSKFMTFESILILIISAILVSYFNLRLNGLIVSNILNMFMRIVYCCFNIKSYYQSNGIDLSIKRIVRYTLPSISITGGYIILQYVLLGNKFQSNTFSQLFKSVVIAFVLLLNLVYLERKIVLKYIKR